MQKTFTDKMWNHYRLVKVGTREVEDWIHDPELNFPSEPIGTKTVPRYKREEHWGTKERCKRCGRKNEMGVFTNTLSHAGKLTRNSIIAILVISICIVIYSG